MRLFVLLLYGNRRVLDVESQLLEWIGPNLACLHLCMFLLTQSLDTFEGVMSNEEEVEFTSILETAAWRFCRVHGCRWKSSSTMLTPTPRASVENRGRVFYTDRNRPAALIQFLGSPCYASAQSTIESTEQQDRRRTPGKLLMTSVPF
jgi:hypothetical protein